MMWLTKIAMVGAIAVSSQVERYERELPNCDSRSIHVQGKKSEQSSKIKPSSANLDTRS